MMGNVNKMMKQVQKLQSEMMKVQEGLKDKVVEASSGGGAVTIAANGHQELVRVAISPDVLEAGDVEMLQDLILAAANEALRKSHEMATNELAKVTGGLNIPGLGGRF